MLNIAICDDEITICNLVEKIILDYNSRTKNDFQVSVFLSGEELIKSIIDGVTYDLLFLDIELNMMNGVDVGKKIRKEFNLEAMHIVYVSSKTKYHPQLFKIRPMDFILKPFDEKEIIQCIQYAMKLNNKQNHNFIYKSNYETYKIPIENIVYFESYDKEIKIICTDKVRSYYGTLKEVMKQVSEYEFISIHRSYIINYRYVQIFSYDKVELSKSIILPISRSKRKAVNEMQNKLLEKEL